MLKLYKKQSDNILYWETWVDEDDITVHQGVVGEQGESESFPKNKDSRKLIKDEIKKRRTDGYAEIDFESHSSLTIEFELENWGSPEDLKVRHKIEDLMDECLGWTGLGHCDGGEIGSGGMSVCCIVVDPYVAVETIVKELKDHNCLEGARIELDPKTDEDDFKVLWPPEQTSSS